MDASAMPFVVAAGWGFLGSIVYATFEIRQRLCAGEEEPTPHERRQAWIAFRTAPVAGTAAAAALSGSLAHFFPFLNASGLAFVIGLASNPLWPGLKAMLGDELRKKIAEALTSVADAIKGKPS